MPRQLLAQLFASTVETVNKTLDVWPGVFSDEQKRIVGYWGLAIADAYKSPTTPRYSRDQPASKHSFGTTLTHFPILKS